MQANMNNNQFTQQRKSVDLNMRSSNNNRRWL